MLSALLLLAQQQCSNLLLCSNLHKCLHIPHIASVSIRPRGSRMPASARCVVELSTSFGSLTFGSELGSSTNLRKTFSIPKTRWRIAPEIRARTSKKKINTFDEALRWVVSGSAISEPVISGSAIPETIVWSHPFHLT